MVETACGLILRTRPLTETSLIIHWLTPQFRRLSTVAKGARRPKSPFRGKLDLFYLADFSFSRSPRSDLHNLREVSLRETHSSLRRELALLQQASYCVALIEQTTETEAPSPSIFGLMLSFLAVLPAHFPQAQTVFTFEIKLLAELGMEPDLSKSRLTAGTQAILRLLARVDWVAALRARLSSAQTVELRNFLQGFLIFHFGRLARGRDAALDISATGDNTPFAHAQNGH